MDTTRKQTAITKPLTDGAVLFNWRAIVVALLVANLAVYVLAGFYVRPEADDFCFAVNVRALGLPGALQHYYATYFGRFSQVVVTGGLSYLGAWSAPLSVLMVIAGFATGVWYALRPLTRDAWLLALAVTVAFLQLLPDVWQSLFWQSAAHTYVAPLMGASLLGGLIIRRANPGVITITSFITAGFNELVPAILLCALLMGWLLLPAYRRWIGAAFIGATVGAVMLLAAPGNAIRSSGVTSDRRLSLSDGISASLLSGTTHLILFTARGSLMLVALGALGTNATNYVRMRPTTRLIAFLALFVVGILIAGLAEFPAYWAVGGASGRVLTLSAALAVLTVTGLLILTRVRLPMAWIAALIVLASIPSVAPLAGAIPPLVSYASEFDAGRHTLAYAELAGLTGDQQPTCYANWQAYYR